MIRGLPTRLRRLNGLMAFRLGRAAHTRPLCPNFGFSRGTPIDRYYIELFVEAHRSDIGGRVLEIGEDLYSRRVGGDRITQQDILHVEQGHPGATIIGDLSKPGVLPQAAFDCIILTQTLHLIYDMAAAVQEIHQALRPGGVALITVPGISAVDRGEWKDNWYWSLTPEAMSRLLSDPFDARKVEVGSYGNLFAATAFLHGAAVEEVPVAKLDLRDEAYPVTVFARAEA